MAAATAADTAQAEDTFTASRPCSGGDGPDSDTPHCGHAYLVERRARTMDAAAGAEGRGRRARRALEPHPRCVCRVVPRGELSRLHDAWAARRDVLHHARGGRQPAHERRTAPSRTTGVGTAPSLGGQLPRSVSPDALSQISYCTCNSHCPNAIQSYSRTGYPVYSVLE